MIIGLDLGAVDGIGERNVATAAQVGLLGARLGQHGASPGNVPILAAVRGAHEREVGLVETALGRAAGLEYGESLCWVRGRARERGSRWVAGRIEEVACSVDYRYMHVVPILDDAASVGSYAV